MSFGGPAFKQHVVEFIVGTGVVTDGVVNATGTGTTVGPWPWTVPAGVAELFSDGVGGGTSGSGGGVSGGTLNTGGGGGGPAGVGWLGQRSATIPGSVLQITIGSGGAAVAAGASGIGGGNTTVTATSGMISPPLFFNGLVDVVPGAGSTAPTGTSASGANGRNSGLGSGGGNGGSAGGVGSNGSPPGVPTYSKARGDSWSIGSGGGGASNATGTVAGANGGISLSTTGNSLTSSLFAAINTAAVGNTTGTLSRGGGGSGAPSVFGPGGNGGAGGAAGSAPASTSYGAGGGGGGGDGGGGAGINGYVRFTYWSAE